MSQEFDRDGNLIGTVGVRCYREVLLVRSVQGRIAVSRLAKTLIGSFVGL